MSSGCCGPEGDNSVTHLCFVQVDKQPEPVLVEVDSNLKLKSTADHAEIPHSSNMTLKNVSEDTKISSSNSTSTSNHQVSSSDSVVEGTDAAAASSPAPQEHDKITEENHTSAFCLPAKPLVSGESTAPFESEDPEDESHYYFKGNTGRCHAPTYSCSQTISSTPMSGYLQNDHSESHCYLPRLVQQQESEMKRFRVVQIHRRQSAEKQSVLFVGNVWDLVDGDVKTTDFVPRDWWFARLLGFTKLSAFPRELETVLLLTAGLSAGLAVVNMLPIYGLDGYHIVDAVVHASVSKGWEGRRAARLVKIISWVALAIALLTIFCSVSLSL